MAAPALSFSDLTFRYDSVVAVREVSLSLAQGEVLCLLGPSGCGKSTLLRLAAGLERVQQGTIALSGEVVAGQGTEVPPEQRRVGLVFQDYALFPHLSAIDNVAFGLAHKPRPERRALALAALERVGLAAAADAFPHTLSGGQQQRVALARALAPEPRVMLMDEPFSGLDARLRMQVREDTLAVLRRAGTASVIVTHDPEEAMAMADRIAVMREGRVLQVAAPGTLFLQPADAFVAGFFGDLEQLVGQVRAGVAETALGPVPAPGQADGTSVTVHIRESAIRLDPAGVPADVLSVRTLGADCRVRLRIGEGSEVTARLTGPRAPAVGSRVTVGLDPDQAFVFG